MMSELEMSSAPPNAMEEIHNDIMVDQTLKTSHTTPLFLL